MAVQGVIKTAKYRKKCFDWIEPMMAENMELVAEVD
jgi:hypothetical protein